MLDITKYVDQKVAGLVSLFKIGPKSVAVSTPRYDPSTGEQLDADLSTFNLENIDKDLATLDGNRAALAALRADVAATLGQDKPA